MPAFSASDRAALQRPPLDMSNLTLKASSRKQTRSPAQTVSISRSSLKICVGSQLEHRQAKWLTPAHLTGFYNKALLLQFDNSTHIGSIPLARCCNNFVAGIQSRHFPHLLLSQDSNSHWHGDIEDLPSTSINIPLFRPINHMGRQLSR